MVHRVSQKKLSRDTDERKALWKNLACSLVLNEKIVTSLARAKAFRPFIEKLITKAKSATLVNRRYLEAKLGSENVVRKLIDLVGPTFKERPGGYTRIIKLPPRSGGAANMAVIEFVEDVSKIAAEKKLASKPKKQTSQGPKEVASTNKEQVNTSEKTKPPAGKDK